MEETSFSETQRFAPWVYVLLLVVCAGTLIAYAVAASVASAEHSLAWMFSCVLLLCCFGATFNLLSLRTRVRETQVYVYLGLLFPMFWKQLPLDQIEECRAIRYRPLRDAGGWGMRFGRFEGVSCTYFNARGDQGVLLETPRRRYVIGSQDPEKLAWAIQQAQSRLRKTQT